MSMTQDYNSQLPQLTQAASVSPRRARKPESFLSVQIPETATNLDEVPNFSTCSVLLPVNAGSLNIWLTSGANVYHAVLSTDQTTSKARSSKLQPEDFIAVIRDSFESTGVKATKKGSKIEVTFSGRAASGALSTVKLDLERQLQDDTIAMLLLNYGASHERQQVETRDLIWKVEELKGAQGVGGATQSFSATEHRAAKTKFKKPKLDPHMSVINPRSRAIKPPKGVVFDEDE